MKNISIETAEMSATTIEIIINKLRIIGMYNLEYNYNILLVEYMRKHIQVYKSIPPVIYYHHPIVTLALVVCLLSLFYHIMIQYNIHGEKISYI